MKKILIIFLVILQAAVAHAQLLEITAADTTGIGECIYANRGDFEYFKFENGRYTLDRPSITPYSDAMVLLGRNSTFIVVLEKGTTLSVNIKKKNGEFIPEYKGKNRDATIFVNELTKLNAHGWQKLSVDENGDEQTTLVRDFDFAAEQQRIEAEYPRVVKLAKKVKDPVLRDKYLRTADNTFLYSRIAIVDAMEKIAGRSAEKNHSAEIEALLSQINPNDTLMDDMGLVERFIDSKRQYGRDTKELTAMSLEYIDLINNYITTPQIRSKFFDNIASSVFNHDAAVFDLDTFWTAFCKTAPKEVVDQYQTVVDSKRATVAGAPCPDATFMDIDGNSHRLSEFFNKGKYLYIDLWATWCGPCCAEIPFIEKHVAHYADNSRIQFISISIDSNINAWKNKLQKDKPQWPQFVTRNKAEYEKLSNDWGITGIPRFIIINPDGTIQNNAAFRPSSENFIKLIDDIISE